MIPHHPAAVTKAGEAAGRPADASRFIVNQLELAELLGRDRTPVQLLIREGLPLLRRGAGRAHQIDLGAALRWIRARDEAACEERVAAARGNLEDGAARSKKLQAEARLAELEVLERELVPADQVEERWGRMVVAMRERVLSLPAVIVQKGLVAGEHEEDLLALAHDALHELAARGAA